MDIQLIRTKRFANTFIVRTAKESNSLPKSVSWWLQPLP